MGDQQAAGQTGLNELVPERVDTLCDQTGMKPLIEIRSINLKPGTRPEFQRLFMQEALPLLKRWNFEVVTHSSSVHAEDSYYVIRRFDSLAQRDQMEEAYYASADWRKGPREAILALFEQYIDIVLELDEVTAQGLRGGGPHLVEIRSYNLKPGRRAEFHRLFIEEAYPMLQRWNVDVVAYGPALQDENSYYLMRRFDSLAQREESENKFYSSAEWRQGPREAVIACIENYVEVVLGLAETTLQGLRSVQARP